jgi:hypothetical protein
LPAASEILNNYRLDLIRYGKPKHPRIEVQLAIKRTLDVLGAAKAVLLSFEWNVGHRDAFLRSASTIISA